MYIRKNIRRAALLLCIAMITAMFAGCAPGSPAGTGDVPDTGDPYQELPPVAGPSEDPAGSGIWAENMNANKTEVITYTLDPDGFDLRFLSYISEHTDGNYMASPLSFRYALGLLLAGASGDTRTELLGALGVESEEEWISFCLDFNGFVECFAENLERELRSFRNEVAEGWISPDAEEPFRALRVANSVWKAERIAEDFRESYRESVSKNYAAEYRYFTADNAVEKINEWADTKTEHMIPELLPEGYDTTDLAVVLMNALYFKDAWQDSFPEYLTKEDDFHTRDGGAARKEFMSTEDTFAYYEDQDTQLVILPMKGGVYMAFVLGSAEDLSVKVSRAEYTAVDVTIPKMDLETEFSNSELVDFLKENGVISAFDSRKADFSAMIDHDLFVSDIIQKTRIKLDEDGVEAAAVTAIMMSDEAYEVPAEPKVFRADRPFSFYIYTTCNGTTAIMFAGEIVE